MVLLKDQIESLKELSFFDRLNLSEVFDRNAVQNRLASLGCDKLRMVDAEPIKTLSLPELVFVS
jgi:hypothetical protein